MTWVKTNMAPVRGWGTRGERLIGKAPYGRWRTLTFVAALRCDGLTAPCVFDGPINGAKFLAYVEQMLMPTLRSDDIVILDNLGSHKSTAVRATIRSTGAKLFFVPPYSPDSSRPSPSSNTFCVAPANAPSKTPGAGSAISSTCSIPPNATTTSSTPATLPPNPIPL